MPPSGGVDLGESARQRLLAISVHPRRQRRHGCHALGSVDSPWVDVELDGLRDEAILYGLSLMRAGVPVELHVYPGGIHASEGIAPMSALAARVNGYRQQALERVLASVGAR